MKQTCRFTKLLEDYRDSGKQIGLITVCGTRLGRVIEINQDYVKFKTLDEESMVFFNVYLVITSIMGIEENEQED
jgi:hypothetical protein